MKLRTEMLRGPDGMTITAGYSEGKYSAREHDAAAAHALMLAMRQYEADFPLSAAAPQDVIQWTEKRANELMREWDFDTGEDA